jgi:putative flavoprotein involved in K+ transport
MTSPILSLNLAEAGIATIIWATGYAVDYSWLNVKAFNEQHRPQHQRGVSSEPGVYFSDCRGCRAGVDLHLGRLA